MDALYKAIHGIISSLLYARNFYIALTDPAGRMLSFPYFLDEFDAPPPPKKLGRGLTEYVLRTGQPLLASDQQVEQMAKDGLIELIGAPSSEWLGVPLKRGERTFGVLVIQSYQEDFHYSERDRELLIFVSQHIADALWRKQAENEIRESQRFLAAVFNGIQDGISVLDRDLEHRAGQPGHERLVCPPGAAGREKMLPGLPRPQETLPRLPDRARHQAGDPPGGHRAAGRQRQPPRLAGAARLSRFWTRWAGSAARSSTCATSASASCWRSASSRPRKWNPSACWPAASPTISTTSWAASWAMLPG